MADYSSLGRLMKQKYPQYSGIDDAILGEKIAAKYPEYAKLINPQEPVTPYSASSTQPVTTSNSAYQPLSAQPVSLGQAPAGTDSLQSLTDTYNSEVTNIEAYYDKWVTNPQVDEETKKEALRQKKEKLDRAKEVYTNKTKIYEEQKKDNPMQSTDLLTQMQDITNKLMDRDTGAITANASMLGLNRIPAMVPGSEGKMTKSLHDQLKSLMSLENIKYLKGQGQVSDAERALLEKASSALNTDLSDEDYRGLLTELQGTLNKKLPSASSTPVAPSSATGLSPISPNGQQTIAGGLERSKKLMETTPKDAPGAKGFLPTVAGALMPNVVSYAKRNLQDIGAGNINNSVPTGREVAVSAFGPGAELLLGTDRQKEKAKAGAEIASTASLVKSVAGAVKGGINYLGAAGRTGSLNPVNVYSQLRNEAIKKAQEAGAKLSPEKVLQAGDEYVKMTDPSLARRWQELKPAVKRMTDPSQALDTLTSWGQQAFSPASGDVRAKATAPFMNKLYGAGREALSDFSPEAAKYTRNISGAIGTTKELGKSLARASIGVAGAVPGAYWLFDTLKKKIAGQ